MNSLYDRTVLFRGQRYFDGKSRSERTLLFCNQIDLYEKISCGVSVFLYAFASVCFGSAWPGQRHQILFSCRILFQYPSYVFDFFRANAFRKNARNIAG